MVWGYLLSDLLVSLVEDCPALRVSEDDPLESNVVQLVDPVHQEQGSGQIGFGRPVAGERCVSVSGRTRPLRCKLPRGGRGRSGPRRRSPAEEEGAVSDLVTDGSGRRTRVLLVVEVEW